MKNLILFTLLTLLSYNLKSQKLSNKENLELLSASLSRESQISMGDARQKVYGMWSKYGKPRIHGNPEILNIRAFHVALPLTRKRIYIEAGSLDEFVAEMAHIVQYRRKPIKNSLKKIGYLWQTGKRFISHPRLGLQWAYDYRIYFEDVKDFEYEAHAIIEPELRKELGMAEAFFMWKIKPPSKKKPKKKIRN